MGSPIRGGSKNLFKCCSQKEKRNVSETSKNQGLGSTEGYNLRSKKRKLARQARIKAWKRIKSTASTHRCVERRLRMTKPRASYFDQDLINDPQVQLVHILYENRTCLVINQQATALKSLSGKHAKDCQNVQPTMIHFSMSFSKVRHLRKSVKNYSKKNTNECWKLLGRDYAMNNVSTSFERALTVLGSTKLRLETNQLRLFLCSCHKEFSRILSQARVLMMFWVCPIPPQTKK